MVVSQHGGYINGTMGSLDEQPVLLTADPFLHTSTRFQRVSQLETSKYPSKKKKEKNKLWYLHIISERQL